MAMAFDVLYTHTLMHGVERFHVIKTAVVTGEVDGVWLNTKAVVSRHSDTQIKKKQSLIT